MCGIKESFPESLCVGNRIALLTNASVSTEPFAFAALSLPRGMSGPYLVGCPVAGVPVTEVATSDFRLFVLRLFLIVRLFILWTSGTFLARPYSYDGYFTSTLLVYGSSVDVYAPQSVDFQLLDYVFAVQFPFALPDFVVAIMLVVFDVVFYPIPLFVHRLPIVGSKPAVVSVNVSTALREKRPKLLLVLTIGVPYSLTFYDTPVAWKIIPSTTVPVEVSLFIV